MTTARKNKRPALPPGTRYIHKPSTTGYVSADARKYALDDAMIARRDAIATALGYIKRPCSMGSTERDGVTPRLCWETIPLDCEWRGRPIASLHLVPTSNPDGFGCVECHWPEPVERIAWKVEAEVPR
jgi:hypothetical protein